MTNNHATPPPPIDPRARSGSGQPKLAAVVGKRDFVDRVIAASGARRAEARPIIEATLDQLGQILSAGQTLVVPPLGRARINLERDARGGDVITLRLRRHPHADRATDTDMPAILSTAPYLPGDPAQTRAEKS